MCRMMTALCQFVKAQVPNDFGTLPKVTACRYQSGTVPTVYDTLRPRLAELFPPTERSADFNVSAASAALAKSAGRKDDRGKFYMLIRGARVSRPWLRDLCDLLGVSVETLPPPQLPLTKLQLVDEVDRLERVEAQLRRELAELTKRLAEIEERNQRNVREQPKRNSGTRQEK